MFERLEDLKVSQLFKVDIQLRQIYLKKKLNFKSHPVLLNRSETFEIKSTLV